MLEILHTKKSRHKRERNLFIDATNQQDYDDLNANEKLIAEESDRDTFKDIILSDERLFENDNLKNQEIPCRNCLVYFEDCKCEIFINQSLSGIDCVKASNGEPEDPSPSGLLVGFTEDDLD